MDGITFYLEVLDTEHFFFKAQLVESNTQERYLGAIVQVYRALGGGCSPRLAPPLRGKGCPRRRAGRDLPGAIMRELPHQDRSGAFSVRGALGEGSRPDTRYRIQ